MKGNGVGAYGRVHSQGFVDDAIEMRAVGQIFSIKKCLFWLDSVYNFLQFIKSLRVRQELVNKPCQTSSGGVTGMCQRCNE